MIRLNIGWIFLLTIFLVTSSSWPQMAQASESVKSSHSEYDFGRVTVARGKKRSSSKRSSRSMPAKKRSKKRAKSRTVRQAVSPLKQALQLAKDEQYPEASRKLFQLINNPRYLDSRNQMKFILGLMLFKMKLYQVSTFQFISVIKSGDKKYLNQSLEKLALAADILGDETLLNYAISRVQIDQFPRKHRSMLYYRLGEIQLRGGDTKSALKSFMRVRRSDPLYSKAKYHQGLSYSYLKQPRRAYANFKTLVQTREVKEVTDPARVAALLGKARALYQSKKFSQSIKAYREIPRDTHAWHDSLFESSWAMLMSQDLLAALNNFQTLHSPFYEDFYQPESMLVRSLVYLYLCRYEEMEKVLNLFVRRYRPVLRGTKRYLDKKKRSSAYFNDIIKVLKHVKLKGQSYKSVRSQSFDMPYLVARKILKEGDFKNSYRYIKRVLRERKLLKGFSPVWRGSGIGKYSAKILKNRIKKARVKAGRQIKDHLIDIRIHLIDLFEQEGFVRYEMFNGKKETQKKRIAGKSLPKETIVASNSDRDYYVQNGYEYWPFKGEFWLDELGTYQYIGFHNCEK